VHNMHAVVVYQSVKLNLEDWLQQAAIQIVRPKLYFVPFMRMYVEAAGALAGLEDAICVVANKFHCKEGMEVYSKPELFQRVS
jgi:hypothetical protein